MKNKIISAIFLIILFFGVYLVSLLSDKQNKFFYSDRAFKVIEMNHSSHMYKNSFVGDYFITVRYFDDNTTWVKSVTGLEFFSMKLNQNYIEKVRTSNFNFFYFIMWFSILVPVFYFICEIIE